MGESATAHGYKREVSRMSAEVKMYTTRFCPFCIRARTLLDSKSVVYTDIGVDGQPALRREYQHADSNQ